jgi:hypothetical protein
MSEKDFVVEIEIKWSNGLQAIDKEHAIEIVKDIFKQEHNLDLDDNEIVSVNQV